MLLKVEGKAIEVNEKLLTWVHSISGDNIKGYMAFHPATPELKIFQTLVAKKKGMKDLCDIASPYIAI